MKSIFKNYYFVYYSILNKESHEIATSSCTIGILKILKFDVIQISNLLLKDLQQNSSFDFKKEIADITIINVTKL